MKKILGVIPARYGSTRFPGKPLADIGGKSMVQRVYEQVKKARSVQRVVVATDHEAIFNHVQVFGGDCVMTREDHPSGTDRCHEAYTRLGEPYDYVVNVQGDEPFIHPEQIDQLAAVLDGDTEIATLIKIVDDAHELDNTGEVKVVVDINDYALYFSRATIPFLRGVEKKDWLGQHAFYKHIGLYAYRHDILRNLTALPVSSLEKAESLEQLRWLENGYRIKTAKTDREGFCVETPEDLVRAHAYLNTTS